MSTIDAAADRLAGLRRAAAAHRERDSGDSRQSSTMRDDVVARFRDDDAERLDLIDAGVGGVERARHRVEADLAGDLRLEIAAEGAGVEWRARTTRIVPRFRGYRATSGFWRPRRASVPLNRGLRFSRNAADAFAEVGAAVAGGDQIVDRARAAAGGASASRRSVSRVA